MQKPALPCSLSSDLAVELDTLTITGFPNHHPSDDRSTSPVYHDTSRSRTVVEESSVSRTAPTFEAASSSSSLLNDGMHPKKARLDRLIDLAADWWLWEVLGALISVATTSALVIILARYDDQSVNSWSSNTISLNAVVAALANSAKASMLLVVAEALSQFKWLRYCQASPRKLKDIDTFDRATRGPWGSFRLLLSLQGRHLVSLGALVIILSAVFETLMQQVLGLRTLDVEVAVASVLKAQGLKFWDGIPSLDGSLQAAVYNGTLFQDSQYLPQPFCPTGNCTWAQFSSVALCSVCETVPLDSNDLVLCEEDHDNCTVTMPGGIPITFNSQRAGAVMIATGQFLAPNLSSIAGIYNPLISLTAVTWNQPDHIAPNATQCAVYVCVNTYDVQVQNGVLNSTISHSWHNNSLDTNWTTPRITADAELTPPHSAFVSNPTASSFLVAGTSVLVEFLTQTLSGSLVCNKSSFSGVHDSNLCDPPNGKNPELMIAVYEGADFSSLVGNITSLITKSVLSIPGNAEAAYGSSWAKQTFFHIRWLWLTAPVLMVFTSLFLLIAVILESWGQDVTVWKSSALAVVYHGLEKDSDIRVNKISEMDRAARNTEVKLERAEGGDWKLVEKKSKLI